MPNLDQASIATIKGSQSVRGNHAARTGVGAVSPYSVSSAATRFRTAAAVRHAVLLVIAELKEAPFVSEDTMKAKVAKYRDWYLKEWRETEKIADQPF